MLLFDEMTTFLPLSWSYFLIIWLFYLYHGELLFDQMTTFLPLSWRVTFWWDDNFSTFIMELRFDQMTTFLPLSWRVTCWWNGEICLCILLDQHAEVQFIIASSVKKQFTGRYVVLLRQIIMTPNNKSTSYTLILRAMFKYNPIIIVSLSCSVGFV